MKMTNAAAVMNVVSFVQKEPARHAAVRKRNRFSCVAM